MKRLITLVLAFYLAFGSVPQASAIEVVPSGVMDFVFSYSTTNTGSSAFKEGVEFDRFRANQRSRIQIDFIANENLRGVMMLQMGTWEWGAAKNSHGPGAALDSTTGTPKLRRLYLSFNFPDSPINMKMGLMDIVLPNAAFGQPVFGNHVAGVTLTANVSDNASLTAFWARPLRGLDVSTDNDMDVFGLWANLDFESFTIAPWVAYAGIGNNSGWFGREFGIANKLDSGYDANGDPYLDFMAMESDTANWWGAGLALKVMPTDNLTIKFDAMYAKLSSDGRYDWSKEDSSSSDSGFADMPEGDGYYFALAVDYAMDWGTIGLFGIYSSGDEADKGNEFGRLPGLAYSDKIDPTRMAFAGALSCGKDAFISISGIGLWTIGLQLADLSFIENINHTARIAYIRGTNHLDSTYIKKGKGAKFGASLPLAKEDAAWEVGFDTYWQMYENLTVGLELGYIYLDATDRQGRDKKYDRQGAFSGNLAFRFGF